MKQSIAPAAIKSSKNVFEQFRKAALEKEQREKALRMHQVEWSREWKAPQSSWCVPENTFAEISFPRNSEDVFFISPSSSSSSSPIQWRAELKAQPIREANFCTEATFDGPRAVELQMPVSPLKAEPVFTRSPVSRERELARQREQERRRRQAVSPPSRLFCCVSVFAAQNVLLTPGVVFPDVWYRHVHAAGHHDSV